VPHEILILRENDSVSCNAVGDVRFVLGMEQAGFGRVVTSTPCKRRPAAIAGSQCSSR
jgi:hypothetical protein